ncbi:MAG: TIGR01777 family protein [Desulfobulbaceae bacterium DB1]|nr:MAG: TIGR01777 family protein [Desulfobulbaceae bacterium DB1]
MKAMMSGGTGFVGKHLAARLDTPILLGRNPARIQREMQGVEARQWDLGRPLDPAVFSGVDTVFHLAGESVFKGRWNAEKKDRILRSRVEGTKNLVTALGQTPNPPATLLCASAIGYYGSRGAEMLNESSPAGNDFLATVCKSWEEEARKAEEFGIRVVSLRIGVVLGADGGALPQMLLPFKLGLGGRLGSGDQYMSWIHIDDLVSLMLHAAGDKNIKGPINAVTPNPVTNREFTAQLAAALHRPALLPVPGFALKIALGEFAEVLLSSQRVLPETALLSGFHFAHPVLRNALADILSSR